VAQRVDLNCIITLNAKTAKVHAEARVFGIVDGTNRKETNLENGARNVFEQSVPQKSPGDDNDFSKVKISLAGSLIQTEAMLRKTQEMRPLKVSVKPNLT